MSLHSDIKKWARDGKLTATQIKTLCTRYRKKQHEVFKAVDEVFPRETMQPPSGMSTATSFAQMAEHELSKPPTTEVIGTLTRADVDEMIKAGPHYESVDPKVVEKELNDWQEDALSELIEYAPTTPESYDAPPMSALIQDEVGMWPIEKPNRPVSIGEPLYFHKSEVKPFARLQIRNAYRDRFMDYPTDDEIQQLIQQAKADPDKAVQQLGQSLTVALLSV